MPRWNSCAKAAPAWRRSTVSPSWRDRAEVFVGPQVLRLAVTPRGWRARTAQTIAQALPDAAAPQAVGHELATALAASVRPGAAVHIVLSNHHVRYAVVGDAALLAGAAERDAAARQALRSVYGEAADGWHIVMDAGSGGAAVVAGVPQDLLDALRNACAAAGAGRVRVEPLFACALNGALRSIGDDAGWVGVLEGGRLVLATLDDAGIRAVRSHRILRVAGEEVAALLQRVRLLDADASGRATLVLASESGADVAFPPDAGLQVRAVKLAGTLVQEEA